MTRTSKIIAGGFLVRAFLGQALFWISYLQLPLARSLQLGNGFWIFGMDGKDYLWLAKAVAAGGVPALFTPDLHVPSSLYIRLLSLLVIVFGGVASLAILINCAAYVLTCAALTRVGRNDVMLAAIAFSPAAILFSTQLLKDTLFLLLIVLMIAAFGRWQKLWSDSAAPGHILACAAAIVAIIYALAGIRWYFAAFVWAASAVFFPLVAWRSPHRIRAAGASLVLFVLLAPTVRLGGQDMPRQMARFLAPTKTVEWKPPAATKLVTSARRGFDRTPGATTIETGRLVATASGTRAGVPRTFAARVVTGVSATFLPRFVAQPLGLLRMGGGRGFWWFAEIDTIVFDLVLLYVLLHCTRALRRSKGWPTPLFLLVVLIFLFTAGPLMYTVNNFGTLFRLRLMLYVLAAALPFTLQQPAMNSWQEAQRFVSTKRDAPADSL